MNVEIGTETAQFSEKEYINGIFVAVEKIWLDISFLQCIILYVMYVSRDKIGKL